MSLELIKVAIHRLTEAGLATLVPGTIGGIVGAVRKKDKDESRSGAIARSALTGAGVGLGSHVGLKAALKAARKGASRSEFRNSEAFKQLPHFHKAIAEQSLDALQMGFHKPSAIAGGIGAIGGGLAGYKLSKRKDKK